MGGSPFPYRSLSTLFLCWSSQHTACFCYLLLFKYYDMLADDLYQAMNAHIVLLFQPDNLLSLAIVAAVYILYEI